MQFLFLVLQSHSSTVRVNTILLLFNEINGNVCLLHHRDFRNFACHVVPYLPPQSIGHGKGAEPRWHCHLRVTHQADIVVTPHDNFKNSCWLFTAMPTWPNQTKPRGIIYYMKLRLSIWWPTHGTSPRPHPFPLTLPCPLSRLLSLVNATNGV